MTKMKVRKPKFDFGGEIPNHWLKGNGLFTHVVNTLSAAFPGGERFFIQSVKRMADKTKSPELREEIKRFIGQEMQHGNAHDDFNEVLEEMGYGSKEIADAFEKISLDYIEPFIAENISEKIGLSFTAAAEHYTATWAASMLANPEQFASVPEGIKQLFLWHACEEVEHKHVAFDLLEETADYPYLTRVLAMIAMTPFMVGGIALGTSLFVAKDSEMTWRDALKLLPTVLTNPGSLGRDLAKAFRQYMKPGFHPSHNDDMHLVHEYLAEAKLAS